MTMPDEGVPSYATGRHTFMILHDYDQKVANDPKMSKAASRARRAYAPARRIDVRLDHRVPIGQGAHRRGPT